MKLITARIENDFFEDLKAIEKQEQGDRAEVIRKLLARGIKEWKLERAVHLLRDYKITLRKAVSLAGVTYLEILDEAERAGIEVGYDFKDLQRDRRGLRTR